MATQPANLPVPSESPRDLKFNAGKIDEFVTSLVNTYVDRFGNEHYTIEGLRWLAQQAISQFGWILIDSFQNGADITIPNQALRDEDTGEYYRWDGALPKHVDAGATPATSGGVGVGAWVGIGDASLRAMLAKVAGAGMIGTTHRGTIASDLNAIDRRPDGYGNSVANVLANGKDVQIEKDISIASRIEVQVDKVVDGAGGLITVTTPAVPVFFSDSRTTGVSNDRVRLENIKIQRAVVPDRGAAYDIFLRDSESPAIDGGYASGFSGGMININTISSITRDVRATKNGLPSISCYWGLWCSS